LPSDYEYLPQAPNGYWLIKRKAGALQLLTPLSEAFGLAHHSGLSNEDSTPYANTPNSFQA